MHRTPDPHLSARRTGIAAVTCVHRAGESVTIFHRMSTAPRIRIPFRTAIVMVASYAWVRIAEQIRAVAFIIIYLFAFQTLILGTPPANAVQIAGGIAMVVFGLALFLEGLLLGIMPLGERVGVHLPERAGIAAIAIFGVLVGVGSTLAEPAVAALRTVGTTVTAWDAPLLYSLLERNTEALVVSIGIGVGIAVALGLVRFYYGLSLKPFIFAIVPVLLAVSLFFAFDAVLTSIIGLAWDSGAVTTGAVTVPLVLALGIGVSRAAGVSEGATSGFGIVMLASALPILAVLVLGLVIRPSVPQPTDEASFFSPERREQSMQLFESEQELLRHAFTRGTEVGRRAYFEDHDEYEAAIQALVESESTRRELLGAMTLGRWLDSVASPSELNRIPVADRRGALRRSQPTADFRETIRSESTVAVRAVLPLTGLLLFVMFIVLRDRPRFIDEFVLGIALAVVGMAVLTTGISLGLAPLGDEAGRQLPRAFSAEGEDIERIIIDDFDRDIVFESIGADGRRRYYFLYHDNGSVERLPYVEERYDGDTGRYEHTVRRPPLFGPDLTSLGIALVFLFAFGLGFGSTLAEPALNAVGRTVEHLTVGTIRRSGVIRAVSLGVGLGLLVGVARILYDIPTTWLLIPPYLLLLPLTWISEEDFAAIAWDSGGVTTGTVTVPLVMAMGLGIGGELDVVDGFGVLALASVFPILCVLLYGLIMRARQHRTIRAAEQEESNE